MSVRSRSSIRLIAVFGVVSLASFALTYPERAEAQDTSAPAFEQATDWQLVGLSALDAVVLRPVGTLSTLGGFAIFLASAPFVAPTGRIETSWDLFVYGAYDYTFVRPLGEVY